MVEFNYINVDYNRRIKYNDFIEKNEVLLNIIINWEI